MFFDDSRPDRAKRAKRPQEILARSPIPAAKSYELMSLQELTNGFHTFVFDIESYPNYFLAAFKDIDTGKIAFFEDSPAAQIDTALLSFVLYRNKLIGFNSKAYDLPMLAEALTGNSANFLNELSNKIIFNERAEFDIRLARINHIDLIEVAPLEASLKMYAARLHAPRIQDLPYAPNTELTFEQAVNVRNYCINDLDCTELLYRELCPHIELREVLGNEYGMDLRSKSDAQVAEAIVLSELTKHGVKIPRDFDVSYEFKYVPPPEMQFTSEVMKMAMDVITHTTFYVEGNGNVDTPKSIKSLNINLGGVTYRMGNGGLHSMEKSVTHKASDDILLIDKDVASYYPYIVLNQGLFPRHLGPAFLEIYRKIVYRRLQAKKDGQVDIAAALKIAINGIFGKFGNVYSKLFAPELVTQITVSGQLYLLMYIERLVNAGIKVVSANTDGVLIKCSPEQLDKLNYETIAWEEATGLITEETRYRSISCRDVNNYIAVKENGTCKTKGVYSEVGSALNSVLSKNPEALIVSDAVQAYLAKGIPVHETIQNCKDTRRFVHVRAVKGGAEKNGVYLGKTVRWYYAKEETGEINYVLSGNKVASTSGAKPLMILPDSIPYDLDYDYYINEALTTLYEIGLHRKPSVGKLI